MNELLSSAAPAICDWLRIVLPALDASWWKLHVVDRLTFQQQRSVLERGFTSLNQLDLAALLRVLDQNWSEIAANQALPRDARTWVKELQSVRNRWAHAPSAGLPPDDAFRDADTLGRLLRTIQAPAELLEQVDEFKAAALSRLASRGDTPSSMLDKATTPVVQDSPNSHLFSVGQLVSLRSNPDVTLPIIEMLPAASGETRYRVFENGTKQVYYESQLRPLDESDQEKKVMSTAELSALLTAIQLTSPSASSLYSLNAGRVRFVPYQYRPVFKLIRADRPRLLVADEVGVGKTIEAALILKELQARHDIKSVLILCPKALVSERKWELELKRFDEHFIPLDGNRLRHCIRETHLNGEWPIQYEKCLVPFSLFDADLLLGKSSTGKVSDSGLLRLDPPPNLTSLSSMKHITSAIQTRTCIKPYATLLTTPKQ